MLIPEVTIYNFISDLIKYVNDDFAKNPEEKTLLYHMFKKDDRGFDLTLNTLNLYEEAKKILLSNLNSPRQVKLHMGFNVERALVPSIHIHFPQESGGALEIGGGAGFIEAVQQTPNSFRYTYNRTYEASVFIFMTSDNSNECLILYNFIKNILLSAVDQLEFVGVRNFNISGEQLQINTDLMPMNMTNRNLTLTFSYESSVPAIKIFNTSDKIEFTGTAVEE